MIYDQPAALPQFLEPSEITVVDDFQHRVEIDPAVVEEYAAEYRNPRPACLRCRW